jgi:hypothetical protein
MEKRVGIWLDFREAEIVILHNGNSELKIVPSEIDEKRPKGGSHSSQPWGAVETISESAYLQRRKQQEARYYDSILEYLDGVTAILVFGPAEAKIGLEKVIRAHPELAKKLQNVESADVMTRRQKIAKVKSFFGL